MFYFENISDYRIKYLDFYFKIWNTPEKDILFFNTKMYLFKIYILANTFIPPDIVILSIEYVDNIIRKNYLLKKYSKKWITYHINKKSPINTCDLELTEIDDSKQYINYIDYEQKQRYLFTMIDFKKLIRSNLEHSYAYEMIPEPLSIKNPYTNKEFTVSELIQINCKLENMPLIWHMFVDSGYDVDNLRLAHYNYLTTLCIPSFVDQLEDLDILYYLNDIFTYFSIEFYCTECVKERVHFRSKILREFLIDWLSCIKFGKIINDTYKDIIVRLYKVNCPLHTERVVIKRSKNIHKEQTVKSYGTYLNLSIPFEFTIGTYTKEDRKNDKLKKRDKLRQKKKKIKNI